ncbi:hypothetical protein MVEN_02551500 [Mycena venus]|uniref:Transposase n=1 Tax=Mycena venus TaxID=2733690 RepID=A0A8H6WUE0_9AGAR|nr:hypothetical protein MVEN_02551500 [Mycena venus]
MVSYLSDDEDEDDPNLSADPPQTNDSPIGSPLPAESELASHARKRQRATVEEVEDEDERYVQDFPEDFKAGKAGDECKTYFETLRDEQKARGNAPWYPFESEEEWELAHWLMTSGLSQKKTDNYLKLKVWFCNAFELMGDELDADQQPRKETVEMWYRNPVECMKELLGNPSFAGKQGYKPIRVYKRVKDGEYSNQEFTEMWTADWWWEIQELLPRGSTLAPIIISTDKTQLTRFSGDKQAWPVYLTIGNIEKGVRRSPSSRATILIGYNPVTKLEIFSKAKRATVSHQLFHDCMRAILEPLRAAGVDGVKMDCADGFVRRMFPVLAAYIADYPEQCLVACCRENSCPRCLIPPKRRGEPVNSTLRDPGETLQVIMDQSQNKFPVKFVDQNLRPINPFWAGFPHCNIFSYHIVKWSTKAATGGDQEIDQRFRTMLPHSTLRHFTRGISLTSQWTGNERKKYRAVAAIIDFIYYAHFETHCDESLARLDAAWAAFHKDKSIFLELEIRKHFDIKKLHKLKHYVDSIRSHGTADGFNTENTEHLHIDFAKAGYRATNKVRYTRHMTVWLARQEAIYNFPRVPVATIVSEFHASDFLIKLDDFLESNSINPRHQPDDNSTFPVYKRLSILLPQISEVTSHIVYDTIRAVRGEPGKLTPKGIIPAKEGRFDTVLVHKSPPGHQAHPTDGKTYIP